ncbi:GLutaRedoXin [Musa troglodytarum]|uniref:GLutaRedoXin n=1 Tax=Musa troglodytarum TaxID=320322 RepID=A0A9E7EX40_9LILI|nr:GLutaRedoXin [Musa troglodytarum]
MVHVVRRLLLGQGVNPVVCEVGEDADEAAIMASLPPEAHDERPTAAVFVGGRLVGGLDRLMAVHISGELVPILKRAGALWL